MQVSPQLLRDMGLRFTRSILESSKCVPENKMWRAVLINALEDAFIRHSDRKNSLQKIEAHNWFIKQDISFKKVCAYGLLDHDDMFESYVHACKTKKIQFTHRQVAWHDYDKLYKKILFSKSKYHKKILRKKLEAKRLEVNSTSDSLISTIIVSAFV